MEWFNNIESSNEQTNEVVQEQELDLWHQEILENYEYKDMFIDFINSLSSFPSSLMGMHTSIITPVQTNIPIPKLKLGNKKSYQTNSIFNHFIN